MQIPNHAVRALLVVFAGFHLFAHSESADAQPMYEGSLTLHYFGNDTTTGTIPPFDARVFTALPLGARCNPVAPGGMTCDGTATLQVGAPLTGSGIASVGSGSPASIMLDAAQLARITSGSLAPPYLDQQYIKTFASLANGYGRFQKGGGPGAVSYFAGPYTAVRIVPGKNQFGGSMRLLKGGDSGGFATRTMQFFEGATHTGSFPTWGVTVLGASSVSGYPQLGFISGFFFSAKMPGVATYTPTALVLGWPWTTGVVSVYASYDYRVRPTLFPEHLVRSGYDNRTPSGQGTIQLVTPHLTQWGWSAAGTIQAGAIGVLRLKFVPEPSSGLAALAGVGLLCVLYRQRMPWSRAS